MVQQAVLCDDQCAQLGDQASRWSLPSALVRACFAAFAGPRVLALKGSLALQRWFAHRGMPIDSGCVDIVAVAFARWGYRCAFASAPGVGFKVYVDVMLLLLTLRLSTACFCCWRRVPLLDMVPAGLGC